MSDMGTEWRPYMGIVRLDRKAGVKGSFKVGAGRACKRHTSVGERVQDGEVGARLEQKARSSAGLVPSASFLRSLSAPVAGSMRKLSSWPSPSAHLRRTRARRCRLCRGTLSQP